MLYVRWFQPRILSLGLDDGLIRVLFSHRRRIPKYQDGFHATSPTRSAQRQEAATTRASGARLGPTDTSVACAPELLALRCTRGHHVSMFRRYFVLIECTFKQGSTGIKRCFSFLNHLPDISSFVFRPLEHSLFASRLFMSPKCKLKSTLGVL